MRNPNPASRLASQPFGARLRRSAIPRAPCRRDSVPLGRALPCPRGAASRPARLKFGSLCTMRHYVTIEGGVSHAKAIVSVSRRRSKSVQRSARAIRRTGHWDMACIRCDFLEAQGTIISPVQNLSFKRIVHPCKCVVYLVPNVPQIWWTVIDQTRIRL